jgi:uncharacterized protein YqjF (DUF2071 family)
VKKITIFPLQIYISADGLQAFFMFSLSNNRLQGIEITRIFVDRPYLGNYHTFYERNASPERQKWRRPDEVFSLI